MKRSASIAVLGLASLFVGGAVQAQTTANGPYYATPSRDQTLAANVRFVVLANFNNDAVLDRETGLVWWRNPGLNYITFEVARRTCALSSVGGRFGWRLPSVDELMSLFDPTVPERPFLPAGHPFGRFPNSVDVVVFTSTPDLLKTTGTMQLGLGISNIFLQSSGLATDQATVFCVRAPH